MSFNLNEGAKEPLKSNISVWWDLESCQFPISCHAGLIGNYISAAVMNLNICGPITISAYGDAKAIPTEILQAFNSTGITMKNVPGGKSATALRIIVDMAFWAAKNPPPATYMLISGQGDFSNLLHRLRALRYKILLSRPENTSSCPLVSAAHHAWHWTELCEGRLLAPVTSDIEMGSPSPTPRQDEENRRLEIGSPSPTPRQEEHRRLSGSEKHCKWVKKT